MTDPKTWLAVCGPTGSGKSDLALALAEALGGEIVGCDSVQLYRGFDVGSAKPTAAERARVPHHLIDCLDWHEDCDAARYAQLAGAALDDVRARGRLPIVTGGTGLYLRALLGRGWHGDLPKDDALRARLQQEETPALYERLRALDPVRAGEIHPNDRFRVVRSLELVTLLGRPLRDAGMTAESAPDPSALLVILDPDRAALHDRIARRTAAMLAGGLVDEVRGLLARGVASDCKPMGSIGYLQVRETLAGAQPEATLAARIAAATRQYAKRQTTWFRKVDGLRVPTPALEPVLTACRKALS